MIHLVLFGDSDIAYWPEDLYPRHPTSYAPLSVDGYSGATLGDLVSKLPLQLSSLRSKMKDDHESLLLIACAGENDIVRSLSFDAIVSSFKAFLDAAFSIEGSGHLSVRSVLFLGPKFEPWLDDHPQCKTHYYKLSRAFEKCCQQHAHSERIQFMNCLLMFCGESANLPGASLGGRASAQLHYFQKDGLHLSHDGYRIWKEAIENRIKEFN